MSRMSTLAVFSTLLWLSAVNAAAPATWQRDRHNLLTNFDNMYNPCVVETGGEYCYRMWFFGWAADHGNEGVPGCDAIFHARSKDLQRWEVYSGHQRWDATMDPTKWVPVVHAGERWYEAWHVGDPSVVFADGIFYLAYSATSRHFDARAGYPVSEGASSWKQRQLREAVSPDGLHWTLQDFIPPDDDADACHVPQALVTRIDRKAWLYLFYATQVGTKRNDGQYHYQYDRIRAMRRPLITVERAPADVVPANVPQE